MLYLSLHARQLALPGGRFSCSSRSCSSPRRRECTVPYCTLRTAPAISDRPREPSVDRGEGHLSSEALTGPEREAQFISKHRPVATSSPPLAEAVSRRRDWEILRLGWPGGLGWAHEAVGRWRRRRTGQDQNLRGPSPSPYSNRTPCYSTVPVPVHSSYTTLSLHCVPPI